MHSAGKRKTLRVLRSPGTILRLFCFHVPVLAETMGKMGSIGSIDAKARQRGPVGVGARPKTDLELVSLFAALFLHC